jgi:hypothetical protein
LIKPVLYFGNLKTFWCPAQLSGARVRDVIVIAEVRKSERLSARMNGNQTFIEYASQLFLSFAQVTNRCEALQRENL